ncbi:MAG: pyrimidine 5'-nucleotidase [Chloroflexi bacterium]|nr:pyrimidine 5'-nucleotidase [Chloroflexota bacterium]
MPAYLFDLDNTMYPADAGITEALEHRMNDYVARISGLPIDQAKSLRQHYFERYGTTLRGLQTHHEVDVESYLADVHNIDAAQYISPNLTLVSHLESCGYPWGVFTNSPLEHATSILRKLGFNALNFPIVDIRAMQFHPKPHPDAYQIALEIMSSSAHDAVLFEDTLHNLSYAKAIGMQTVYISHAASPDIIPPYVDHCFSDITVAVAHLII